MGNKEIQTVVGTRFTGDLDAVRVQASSAKPINNEEIIARNTTKTIETRGEEVKKPCTCGSNCCRGNQ